MTLPTTSDIEEGDRCFVFACTGRFRIKPVEGCTCFQSAPCPACTSTPLVCDKCEIEISPEDE